MNQYRPSSECLRNFTYGVDFSGTEQNPVSGSKIKLHR